MDHLNLRRPNKAVWGLFIYNEVLPDFIYRPIKAFRWSKFFLQETRLDVVNIVYAAKYHLINFYVMVEGQRIYFNVKAINELYSLPNNVKYSGHELINNHTRSITREVLKNIIWPNTDWEKTPTMRLQFYSH